LALHPLGDRVVGGGHLVHVFDVGVFHLVEQSTAARLVTLISTAEVEADAARIGVQGI